MCVCLYVCVLSIPNWYINVMWKFLFWNPITYSLNLVAFKFKQILLWQRPSSLLAWLFRFVYFVSQFLQIPLTLFNSCIVYLEKYTVQILKYRKLFLKIHYQKWFAFLFLFLFFLLWVALGLVPIPVRLWQTKD